MIRAIVLALLLPAAALAHGEADWIEKGGYYNGNVHCCGSNDCCRQRAGAVVRRGDGWFVRRTGQTFRQGDPGVHWSVDHDAWICWSGDTVRCLFVPAESF